MNFYIQCRFLNALQRQLWQKQGQKTKSLIGKIREKDIETNETEKKKKKKLEGCIFGNNMQKNKEPKRTITICATWFMNIYSGRLLMQVASHSLQLDCTMWINISTSLDGIVILDWLDVHWQLTTCPLGNMLRDIYLEN